MTLPDPVAEGFARGWKHVDGATLSADGVMEADVVVIGTGAGGGMSAEHLAQAGFRVILVEEGGLRTSRDFRLLEAKAYPELYQESAARKTADQAITILQGRTVGGSTTVNWTSCFRTPPSTLDWWRERHGLSSCTEAAMAPWFAAVEARLGIADWNGSINANNAVLERGCQALGIPSSRIRRNVKGCWNLGYCGMGCATNAKQSMLVTCIPGALSAGATLLTRLRAWQFDFNRARDAITAVRCQALGADGMTPTGRTLTLRARQFVLAGGAIGTPALLLRSNAPDPWHRIGRRTFLHPVALSGALFDAPVNPFDGAPQTVYTDHHMRTQPIDGPLGFKLEVPPVHPLLLGATLSGFGAAHAALMRRLPNLNVTLALLRDGFHRDSRGGEVRLRDDGTPLLDYPLGSVEWEALRRAWLAMAEIQFAAGAKIVLPVHEEATPVRSMAAARREIAELPMRAASARVVSAHVMGGAAMSGAPEQGVVDGFGQSWQLRNLVIADGSVFPTSIGANPQLSVYAFSLRAADALARRMRSA